MNKTLVAVFLIATTTFALLFSTAYFANSWVSVDAGHALLVINMHNGEITPVLGPTAGFILNGWDKILGYVKTVDMYYATDSFDGIIPCFSADQLEMNITVQMRWQLNKTKLVELYKSYPKMDYEQTAINSIMEKNIRFVTRNYTALATIANRPEIAQQMQTLVFDQVAKEPSLVGALSYMTFDLKNIAYPENYTHSIEEKLSAQQRELQAQFERERILILANATAQQTIIQALAEAQAKIAIANGTQQAIQRILVAGGITNETQIAEITKMYIQTEALIAIAPYIKTLIMMQSGTPLVTIPP
jgi:regulator of protease activity HflC (stomatin/prohibitin superfamily)